LNFSSSKQKVGFDLGPQGLAGAKPSILLGSSSSDLSQITLDPFAVYMAKLMK
jgi:hypothetical protein